MYSPPPHRRPWSPDNHQQRREASDVSIEALDLADYAMTLDTPTRTSNHAPTLTNSHDTFASTPRSRPFSLPNTPSLSSHATSSRTRPRPRPRPSSHRSPHIVESNRIQRVSEEIDISHFPKWSQGWYNKSNNNLSQNSIADPDADIYTPAPPSAFYLVDLNKNKGSVFDPGYIHDPRHSDPYSVYDARSPPIYSSIHNSSTRDLLPWTNDSPQYEPPIEPALREERMRMLEKEFGNDAKGTKKDSLQVDQDAKPVVGSIDDQGRLVTTGSKKRVFIRVLQILLAITAAVPSIYAALAIKPSNPKDPPPPPANKPPAYVLYIISAITIPILLYLFVVRPCCCIRKKPLSSKHPLGASGMMVLPVNGPGGRRSNKPKGQRGAGPKGQSGDMQINLIVDPTAFQHPDVSESEDSEDDDSLDEAKTTAKTKQKRKRNHRKRRRGVFEGLAMEEQWLAARSWLRKTTMVDVAGLIIWGATFVFVLTGKRCPSGGFGGWCNAYNVSTAAACLLCVAFAVSIFFDVQDLHASKQSPRTRT